MAAIPASVLPDHVDHSADDLIARAARLTSMQQGLTFLQQLTPGERDRLARSDSPLAALADVPVVPAGRCAEPPVRLVQEPGGS